MYYAVKSVNDKEINGIFSSWAECSKLVLGKVAVYRSFPEERDARAFLENAPVSRAEYGQGYVPIDVNAHSFYGKFAFARFRNKETGFCIYVYQSKKGEKVTCKGYDLPDNKRMLYKLAGTYNKNPKFGYEFVVTSWKEHVTDTKSSIIGYLSCGLIKGIGEAKAEQIYDMFGSRTLEILESNPQKLLMVKGIGKKGLNKIIESYKENHAEREITSYLLKFGISPKLAMKIYQYYGLCAIERIKENPYELVKIKGITFDDAERIAAAEKYPANSHRRYHAGIAYILANNEASGNTGMEVNHLCNAAAYKMNQNRSDFSVSAKDVFEIVLSLLKEGKLKHQNMEENGVRRQYVFKKEMYEMEKQICDNIIRLCKSVPLDPENLEGIIRSAIGRQGLQYDRIQAHAAKTALTNHLCVMTGEPGTGKTTNIKIISDCYHKLYPERKRIFLAPTGRAARKISEAVGTETYTIHSYLHLYEGASVEDEISIDHALVVVDEFSMTDVYVANAIFKAIGTDCNLVLVGDIDQLPSVGPGAVLRDIIESQAQKEKTQISIPIVKLKQVYRQKTDARIYENAAKINRGDVSLQEGCDYHHHELKNMEDIRNEMAELYVKRVKEFGLGNVMCLCPVKEHTAGVNDMNILLQGKLNPHREGVNEVKANGQWFREGDLIMHLKNNDEASNGDTGIIEQIENADDPDSYIVKVLINNKHVSYGKSDMDLMMLSYATTVHKAQGSEADAVLFCLTNRHLNMLYRNIPYVAISRGKKQVDIFGEESAMTTAILNKEKRERITLLKKFLMEACGYFVAA